LIINPIRRLLHRVLVLIILWTFLILAFAGHNVQAYVTERTTVEGLVEAVASDVNTFWGREFGLRGYPYSPAGLTFVYDQHVPSACGPSYPELGPGYCPADQTFYYPVNWVDPSTGLRLQEYGDFAVAMATAHEMAHHAQYQMNRLGIQRWDYLSDTQSELQADCFGGAWARQAFYNNRLEPGDIEEALTALSVAGSVGHGTSEQRGAAYMLGYNSGDIAQCLAP
jgi:uncharacterized protein